MARGIDAVAGADRPSLVVVGGGVIGGAVALAFLDRGWRVVVVDKGAFGQEASAAAGGMLCPGAEVWDRAAHAEIFAASGALHRPWTESLEARTGIAVRYIPSGLLRLAGSEAEAEALRRDAAARETPYPALRPLYLDREAVRAEAPAVAEDTAGGLLFASDAQLEPACLLRALRLALARAGGRLLEGVSALSLIEHGGRIAGVGTVAGAILGDLTVVAAGAWSTALLGPWLEMPVVPHKGQRFSVRAEGVTLRPMLGPQSLVLPRPGGVFVLGATVERVGFDKTPTARAIGDLFAASAAAVPALAGAAFGATWAGLRPATPDEMPYLGAVPGLMGVLVATGHFTYGIFLAPLTARIVLALAEGEAAPVDLSPFRPERHAHGPGVRTWHVAP